MTTCPTRPRLVDGLVLAPLDRGIVFDGAARRQVLRGPAAGALLPRLLPLLDGTRPLPDLAHALADVAPATLEQAVTLLWQRGLVEEGSARPDRQPDADPDLAAFVGRLAGSTSHNRNGSEALARLAAAEVIVVADGPSATRLAAELTGAGIGRVRTDTVETLARTRLGAGPGPRPLVVALAASTMSAESLAHLDDRCADAGVAWLRTAIGTGGIEIGPCFDDRSSACYRCFAAGLAADDNVPATGPAPSTLSLAAWASLVAIEVAYLTARIGRTVSTGGLTRLDPGSWRSAYEPAIRRPGCRRCCPLPTPDEHPVTPAYRREQAALLPGPELLELADHRGRPTRQYPQLPLALRPGVALPRSPWTTAARLNPQLLACVLGHAVAAVAPGQDPAPGAPAISLAAISPVQAYVFVHRIVDIGNGWHWWHSRDRVFVRVRASGDDDLDPALAVARGEGPAGRVRTPGAVIALTASLAQLEETHGPVGHRLAHLATGRVAYAVLDGLARAGMPARLRPPGDDLALAAAIGLDPALEPVTALIDLPARRVAP